jgi:hypothetical protein
MLHFSALAFLRGPSPKLRPKLWALTGGTRLNFLNIIRRLTSVSAYNLGLSLGEGPRINAKALKWYIAAGEGIIVVLFRPSP